MVCGWILMVVSRTEVNTGWESCSEKEQLQGRRWLQAHLLAHFVSFSV